jgi:tetratricopeptide (TPR) repeat protein
MRRERYADYMRAYELRDRMTAYERAYATGHYFAITGEYEKAVEAMEAYHDLYPEDPRPLNILGLRYARLRDFAHSEEMFLQLSESFLTPPSYVRNGVFRAQVNQGKYEEAEETLRRWREAMPEDRALFGNRVSYAGARWDYGTLQAYLDFLSSLGPSERAAASWGLSALAAVQGKVDRAEQHFQGVGADELSRLSWLPYLRLALLGDTVGAIDTVEAVLDRSPLDSLAPDGRPYLDLAGFYARAGRPESARGLLAEYDTVIREFIDPTEREHRRGLDGVIALAEGRPEQAIPHLRLAHERVLDSPISYLPELAMAFQQAGEPDSALVQYERYLDTPYLDRFGDDSFWLATVYERLAGLYEERGDVEEAVEYYGKLVELWRDCDPELRPRVEAAERAIVRLRGGP